MHRFTSRHAERDHEARRRSYVYEPQHYRGPRSLLFWAQRRVYESARKSIRVQVLRFVCSRRRVYESRLKRIRMQLSRPVNGVGAQFRLPAHCRSPQSSSDNTDHIAINTRADVLGGCRRGEASLCEYYPQHRRGTTCLRAGTGTMPSREDSHILQASESTSNWRSGPGYVYAVLDRQPKATTSNGPLLALCSVAIFDAQF